MVVLDQQIDALLRYFGAGSGDPIGANLLALNFHKNACVRTDRVGLPRSLIDMYEDAIREFLAIELPRHPRLKCEADQVTRIANACYEMFYFVAKLIAASDENRSVPADAVLRELRGANVAGRSNGKEILNLWEKLRVADGEHGYSAELPPFLKDVPAAPLEGVVAAASPREGVPDPAPRCEGVGFVLDMMCGFFALDSLVGECTKKPTKSDKSAVRGRASERFEGILNQEARTTRPAQPLASRRA